ncbi:MAG: alcohol dehydrogenase catalytic domain-containing protein [Anaerolineae bacterium]
MADNLEIYRQGVIPPKRVNLAWPLYGAGMECLGKGAKPVALPWPECGPDELLVRHDACVLCPADVKLIRLGENHPRISRDLGKEPVIPGHEVALTIVSVGEHLRGQYQVGDRFIVQPDIYKGGVGYGYGFMLQGGLSQYAVLDHRVLEGDAGCYLLPVRPETGYAEAAMAEPWAAVVATYHLQFRTKIKPGGVAWIVGVPSLEAEGRGQYYVSQGLDTWSHPRALWVTNVPREFKRWLEDRASGLGVELISVEDVQNPPPGVADDIVLLGADADLIEKLSPHLAPRGVFTIVADRPLGRKVRVDIGRIHYDRILYIGGPGPDIAEVYATPVRSSLKPGGRAWFVGAGGPIGQMHVQYALLLEEGPNTVFCTALRSARLQAVESAYHRDAAEKGVEFICVAREEAERYLATLQDVGSEGFDDIIVLAPDASATEEAAQYLRPGGVLNVFTGVARGTVAELDLSALYLRGVRYIGFSGSTVEEMRKTLEWIESGSLSPNRLVMAVGSLSAAREGLEAVSESRFPGKVVIYPNIQDFPLTRVNDLGRTLPSVHALLTGGREWNKQAEDEFLRALLD